MRAPVWARVTVALTCVIDKIGKYRIFRCPRRLALEHLEMAHPGVVSSFGRNVERCPEMSLRGISPCRNGIGGDRQMLRLVRRTTQLTLDLGRTGLTVFADGGLANVGPRSSGPSV